MKIVVRRLLPKDLGENEYIDWFVSTKKELILSAIKGSGIDIRLPFAVISEDIHSLAHLEIEVDVSPVVLKFENVQEDEDEGEGG